MATRTIKVFSSKVSDVKPYVTDVTTWGALRELIQKDYDLTNMKATESVGKTSLEHIDAVLPETDFILFLRPAETKSGLDFNSASFKEMRDFIKADSEAKKFLNSLKEGKNFTQFSTEELRAGLLAYVNANSSQLSDEEEPKKEKKEKTHLKRLEKILKKLLEVRDTLAEEDIDLFEDELEYDFDEVEEHLNNIIYTLKDQKLTEPKSAEYEDLRKQADDLFSGFLN